MATEESGASTLKHLLERRRAESPDAPAYAFIDERLNCTRLLTRASLQREAESLASTLRCAAPRGERALLLFPDGPGAVIAFWACMLAELIAVPAPAPEAGRMKTAVPRLEGIAKDCEPALVLAPSEVVEATRRVDTSFLNPARCIVVDDAAPDSPPCARHEAMQAEDLGVDDAPAYLQYTSGSTTTPRGVVIRHRNVLANCAAMAAASGTTSSSRMLSWLPYFHDYGLVSGIIAPLYAGIPAWLMKPSSFLRRPLSWLEAIERFSITHTGAPAFAYAACTRALRRTPGWRGDLSRLQFASCGAEPIDARVVDEFLDAFRPYGFEKAAFSPAYGLAEATLAVTMSSAGSHTTLDVDAEALRRGQVVAGRQTGPPDVRLRRIVGCGTALDGLDVVVVSPDTLTPADPGTVGEVWVAGPSVAKGYWKATAEVADLPSAFGHHLAGHEGEFLRTGDLGFTAKGNLFITGRRKDLLIISGRNVHPQDVEWTVERALAAMSDDGAERRPDHRAGHCAVFSIEHDGEEQAVVVHEVRRGADSRRLHSLARAIRKAVAEEHDLALREVAFVAPGSIP